MINFVNPIMNKPKPKPVVVEEEKEEVVEEKKEDVVVDEDMDKKTPTTAEDKEMELD